MYDTKGCGLAEAESANSRVSTNERAAEEEEEEEEKGIETAAAAHGQIDGRPAVRVTPAARSPDSPIGLTYTHTYTRTHTSIMLIGDRALTC